MEHQPKGTHYLIDLFDCNPSKLNDKIFIENLLLELAALSKTTILNSYIHQFEPAGLTGSVVIAESHINIHTWPEHAFAATDVFTCGDGRFPQKACDYLKDALEAKRLKVIESERGFKTL